MASKAEMFGRALGKAVKHTVSGLKPAAPAPVMFRASIANVPPAPDFAREHGWTGAQVQLLIDKASAEADHTIARAVLKPGARHALHRHLDCDAFLIVLEGAGMIDTDAGDTPARAGDVVYLPRGCWHGFNNTSNADVVLLWGLLGAGSLEASGYHTAKE
jgi:mannose-6-phosphate isomerase-like protein (cupin superfamily)